MSEINMGTAPGLTRGPLGDSQHEPPYHLAIAAVLKGDDGFALADCRGLAHIIPVELRTA
jgi:hypothetical protein